MTKLLRLTKLALLGLSLRKLTLGLPRIVFVNVFAAQRHSSGDLGGGHKLLVFGRRFRGVAVVERRFSRQQRVLVAKRRLFTRRGSHRGFWKHVSKYVVEVVW
jgi:hypothetical protein